MKFIILIFSLICACCAIPMLQPSYIQQINVSYVNDLWTCGNIQCPTSKTFGCHVQMFNNKMNMQFLNTIYTCIDESMVGLIATGDTEDMGKSKTIDVNLWSYIGAESLYVIGYYLGGQEYANGTVAVNGWEKLKKDAASNQKAVEESNNQWNLTEKYI